MRLEKIKSFSSLRASTAHNLRTTLVKNADHSKSRGNEVLLGTGDSESDIKAILSRLGLKPRKNSVLAFDGVLTLSSVFFESVSLEDFKVAVLEFLDSEFKNRVTTAVLHVDETSPHVHFTLCPIVKNKGCSKVRLSARDYMNVQKMRGMQRRLYEHMKRTFPDIDMKPPRHGNKASHTKISHFYELLERDSEALAREVIKSVKIQLENEVEKKRERMLVELDSYMAERFNRTKGEIKTKLSNFYREIRREAKYLSDQETQEIDVKVKESIDRAFIADLVNSSMRDVVHNKSKLTKKVCKQPFRT